ncbi:MAG: bifunctional oligoribonuclease/PAP phosphatase NrnA [Anaerolineae bacterium]|nr:bifunctional oligoribonuclease/PAP phosphatase NrnA [Anaerolineae bacterium]
MMTNTTELREALDNVQRIAIATHVDPDPDAIGSATALGLALRAMGKDIVLLCDGPPSPRSWFLPLANEITTAVPSGFEPELLVALDSSDRERLGVAAAPLLEAGIPIINIDHHVTNLQYGSINIVNVESSATAELLVSLIDALGVEITLDIARCLMAGLVGDTRAFSTPSVTPKTFAIAARLVEVGVDIADIVDRVHTRMSFDQLRLWGLALADLHLQDGVIWVSVPQQGREMLGVNRLTENGLSSLLLNAKEACVSASFIEKDGGQIEISFRARPGYNVADIALSLGGGGHALASGCTIAGPLDQAVHDVVYRLRKHVIKVSKSTGVS